MQKFTHFPNVFSAFFHAVFRQVPCSVGKYPCVRTSGRFSVGKHVKHNSDQKHCTFDDILPGIADSHDGHSHVDDAEQECADDHAADGADAAVRRCAADEAGTDCVHLKGSTGVSVYGTDTRCAEHARESGEKSHVRVGDEVDLVGVDAGELGRFLVAADRVEVAAERCL